MPVQRDRGIETLLRRRSRSLVQIFAEGAATCNDPVTMRHLRIWTSTLAFVIVALVGSGTALARRHTIERGETLDHIARAYNCSVAEIQRANGIDTTLIRAGRTLRIP